jgi:tRNA threonylcarbamoyladenosine biosynthesis protein TsaE
MEILSTSTEKTKELARVLAKKLKPGDILTLQGDIGAGKTTFTSFLVSELGIKSRVQSPTFVLVRRYKEESLKEKDLNLVNHIDLYRLQNVEEIKDIGFFDIINEPNSLTVIEWPEMIMDLLPKDRVINIIFSYKGENEREIKIQDLY